MRDRAILHSDANCFYASVETVLNPEFRGKAIAVCVSPEERHGIVLAKSEKAKRAGVKTGMANWQAKQCCRDLIIVPPQYDYYLKFSKLLHGMRSNQGAFFAGEPIGSFRDFYWCKYSGSQLCPRQTRFYCKTANRVERMLRNGILVGTVCEVRYSEQRNCCRIV